MQLPLTILGQADAGAAASFPAWLPWALVGAGAALLAVVAALLLKGRGDAGNRAGHARAEVAELQARLMEVKKLAASVAEDLDRRAERLERLIAQADDLLERGGTNLPAQRDRARAPQPPQVDDLSQRVFALSDQGHSPVQIAQALRQPIGNIELMLALRGGGAASER